MPIITLPEPSEQPLTLEARQEKGESAAPEDGLLEGWISLGEVHAPITAADAGEDPALQRFLATEGAQAQFHLLHLACSFVPKEAEEFDKAWLRITLRRGDAAGPPDPIAWSLDPKRVEHPVPPSRSVTLSAELQIVPKVLGVGMEVENASTEGRSEVFLRALNELQPNPIWEFSRTSKEPIRGAYRLSAVLRLPQGAPVQADVSLDARVVRKRYGIIPYRAFFGDRPRRSIQLQ